jgi:hypothetical protein
MKTFWVIFIKFENLEVIYLPIFKCFDVSGVFIFALKCTVWKI